MDRLFSDTRLAFMLRSVNDSRMDARLRYVCNEGSGNVIMIAFLFALIGFDFERSSASLVAFSQTTIDTSIISFNLQENDNMPAMQNVFWCVCTLNIILSYQMCRISLKRPRFENGYSFHRILATSCTVHIC